MDFGIPALMRRGSRSTDLVSDTPQVGFTGEVELPEEPDIVGSASDIGPPRTIDAALGPMTVSDTVPLPREEPTAWIFQLFPK